MVATSQDSIIRYLETVRRLGKNINFKFAVTLLDYDLAQKSKERILKADATHKDFDALAKKMNFSHVVMDTSLTGYHYVNDLGDCLRSRANVYKEGFEVDLL